MGFYRRLDFCHDSQCAKRTRLSHGEIEKLCRAQKGVIVLDEAYVDFARENAFALALKFPQSWSPGPFPRPTPFVFNASVTSRASGLD